MSVCKKIDKKVVILHEFLLIFVEECACAAILCYVFYIECFILFLYGGLIENYCSKGNFGLKLEIYFNIRCLPYLKVEFYCGSTVLGYVFFCIFSTWLWVIEQVLHLWLMHSQGQVHSQWQELYKIVTILPSGSQSHFSHREEIMTLSSK